MSWFKSDQGIMNKKEAAAYLGCSERAIERYVQSGKISCSYEKGKTRTVAVFTQSELDKIKYQSESVTPAYETIPEPRQTATLDENELTIYHDEPVGVVEVGDISKLSAMVELLLVGQQLKASDKLVLTVDECHQLTGLPREMIKEAIASGELAAKKIGRSWRIKRSCLDAYIDEIL
jgi:excisionase family DNA binding protein